ncbi:SMI1/KNR4 family protein [Oleomonas cavernae]|uniref:SMI1/KNR4 family protein n=1 Tax=Oleomonas cavernae TaxID=2320859 RepID=UPI0011C42A78|nr:SMI1/KNR4 family protein [Oleomonas cavernae]
MKLRWPEFLRWPSFRSAVPDDQAPLPARDELQCWWRRTAAGIVAEDVTDAQIRAPEARYDVVLPEDFRDYLRCSSPVEFNLDEHFGNWWGIREIKNIPDEWGPEIGPLVPGRADQYLFFLDHCFWAWAWAISCADDESRGKVVLIAGIEHDKVVADSFTDFVRKYTRSWGDVL